MKKFITILLVGTAAIFMSACGGSSDTVDSNTTVPDDTNTTEPNTNKYDLRTFMDIPGYTIYGVATIGEPAGTINGTGSYQVIYNGPGEVPTHTHEVIMTLTGEETTVDINFYAITYMGHTIYTYDRISEVECTTSIDLSTIIPVPTDAQIGYRSDSLRLNCDDGIYKINYIHLDDVGGGNAELSIINGKTDSHGAVFKGFDKYIFTVTPDMRIINAEIISYNPMDTTGSITALYSTSIEQD